MGVPPMSFELIASKRFSMSGPISNPKVVVIAGPNGAGKTTASRWLLQGVRQVPQFVNADTIARGLSAFNPESVAMEAGRVMIARLNALEESRADFAFETTLASRSFAPRIRRLCSMGYECSLYFFFLSSADEAVARVAVRVSQGGHHVPESDIRQRYVGGLRNFFSMYKQLTSRWEFYDNTLGGEPRLIASGVSNETRLVADPDRWNSIRETYERP